MKYVVILADGMADEGCKELGGKTPLQYAHTPNMDFLAGQEQMGMIRTVPEGYPPGSDVANLSVLGYDPRKYYTGRSPLEAVSMGVELGPNDTAFRCNLVTLSGEENYADKIMVDYCAGEISSEESEKLIKKINSKLSTNQVHFYPGVSYRHLMVWRGGPENSDLTPPHDIPGQRINKHLPKGEGSEFLRGLMQASYDILKDDPVNTERVNQSKNPANSIWLWGQGKKPSLTGFYEKFGLQGAVISAVDLIKGIGICAGMKVLEVQGATGNIHTNFPGKAEAALKGLEGGLDFVYIHVEAPDEAGHQGDLETKIKAIEEIDKKVLGEILYGLKNIGEFKLMVLPDHPTPVSIRTHTADPVPFVIYHSGCKGTGSGKFDEETARKYPLKLEEGHTLMDYFLKK